MENKEQQKRDGYKKILKMDLYHCANSIPNLDEIDDEEKLMNKTVQRIDENSKDLPANKKRCFLCNTVAVGKHHNMETCECNFLVYDHNYSIPEHSRYLIDLERLKNGKNK